VAHLFLDNGDINIHTGAKILAHVVKAWRLRLHSTHLVRGPCHDIVLPWLRVPDVRPAHPQPALARRFEVCRMPGLTTVETHFHLHNRSSAAPGPPTDNVGATR